MKPWIIVGFALVLIGCSSLRNKLNSELRPYVGQNITALSAVLGGPDTEREIVGETRYTWMVDNHFTMTLPRSNLNFEDMVKAPFLAIDHGTRDVSMHYVCNLQVITDQAGTIKAIHSSGNEGCQRFVSALDL